MQHDHPAPPALSNSGFFSNLLQDYVPRQVCMYHQPDLIGLHIFSDSLITLAYFSIPVGLVYFARRRKDLSFNWMFPYLRSLSYCAERRTFLTSSPYGTPITGWTV